MTITRRDLIATVLVVPLASLWSCADPGDQANEGSSSQQRALRIYLVLKTLDNPFFTEIQRGAVNATRGTAALAVRAGRNESDISGQRQILEQIAVQEASSGAGSSRVALILTPSGSSDQLVGAIRRFRDQNMPVVLLDTKIDQAALDRGGTSVDLFIGSDNAQGGALAADAVMNATRHVPGRPVRILLLNGAEESETAQTRRAGFLGRIRGRNVDVIERAARWRRSEAQNIVETLLASGDTFDAIFAANDEMALGVVGAYANRDSQARPPVVGFDAIPEARQAVRDGVLLATVAQDPYQMGRAGAEALIRGINPAQRTVMIPVELITR